MLTKRNKAQSTLEYALLLAGVIGALLFMQNYLKRSLQGRLQQVGDQLGDQYSPGLTYRSNEANVSIARIEENESRGYNSLKEVQQTSVQVETEQTRRLRSLEEEVWPE